MTYDNIGEQLSVTSPATSDFPNGVTKYWTYTQGSEPAVGGGTMPKGLVRTESDGRNNVSTFSYDSHGDLRTMTDRAGCPRQLTTTRWVVK